MKIDLSRMKRQLIAHEGLRLKPYRCTAGKLTIGVGRNLDDVGITEEEAAFLLDGDIRRAVKALSSKSYFKAVEDDDVRSRVLVDMCFNLGIAGLDSFKNTLAAVERHDFATAADLMLQSKWASQVGQRAVRLAKMMRFGQEY